MLDSGKGPLSLRHLDQALIHQGQFPKTFGPGQPLALLEGQIQPKILELGEA